MKKNNKIKKYKVKGMNEWDIQDKTKRILIDYGYNWRNIGNVSFDYEIQKNQPDTYIDFRKNFIMEISQNLNEEVLEVRSFKLKNLEELENYIKKLSLYKYDRTLQKLKIYKESLKGKSNKKIVRNGLELKEGDILNSSWGYEQTNVEFFIVKRILGNSTFIIQEVKRKYEKTIFMAGRCKATKKELDTLPKKAFVNKIGYITISETGYKRSLSLTDLEETHYTSSYA